MITLHLLDRGDGTRVTHIAVHPDQRPFCGTVAEALADDPGRVDLHMICRDGAPVGLFKVDRGYPRDYSFASAGDLGLRAVMVDAAAQGTGVGKAAMTALHGYLPTLYSEAEAIWLTVNFRNPAARAVYLKSGFTETGEIWRGGKNGPQHVMRLALRG